jgi:hypothetical protein
MRSGRDISSRSGSTERQYAQSHAAAVDRDQRTTVELLGNLPNGRDDPRAQRVGIQVVAAHLNHARLLSLGSGKDRAEVKVVREHDLGLHRGVAHDLRISRIRWTNY